MRYRETLGEERSFQCILMAQRAIIRTMKKTRPLPTLTERELKNFWAKVRKTDSCWIWTSPTESSGHARFQMRYSRYSVHRLSYFIHTGIDPLERLVCHSCDVPNCVNPSHLFLGTPLQNTRDALSKWRLHHGQNHYNAKLTDADVVEIRKLRAQGETLKSIAHRFGVHLSLIHLVAHRRNWKHIS